MKRIATLILLAAVLTGCAHRNVPRPPVPVSSAPSTGVRYPEVVRSYAIGRTVDSGGLMHETHPIWRVEAGSRWDLHPGPVPQALLNPPADPAYSPAPLNDAITAELQRQQDATERVMWEAGQLANSYDQLQKVIQDMTWVAREYAFTKEQLRQNEIRLEKLEELVKRLGEPPLP